MAAGQGKAARLQAGSVLGADDLNTVARGLRPQATGIGARRVTAYSKLLFFSVGTVLVEPALGAAGADLQVQPATSVKRACLRSGGQMALR